MQQLADFNKVLFKKDVSPFKKWAYIEGLATFLKVADLMNLMSAYLSPRQAQPSLTGRSE
jgi:hypothetical protein